MTAITEDTREATYLFQRMSVAFYRPMKVRRLSRICRSGRRLSASPSSACDVTGSLYVLQFLIHSTLVLVTCLPESSLILYLDYTSLSESLSLSKLAQCSLFHGHTVYGPAGIWRFVVATTCTVHDNVNLNIKHL